MVEPGRYRPSEPCIRFVLGGVQKGGTTALSRFLALHPALALPHTKEAHVFDAPDYNDAWSVREVDRRFASHFQVPLDGGTPRLRGDATPITVFHPRLIARVARYNPEMRWVILLRDPVQRAISHYFMERERGLERRGLLTAILIEKWRLHRHRDDWSTHSPLRVASYCARSRYSRQLDVLFSQFPRDQVLLLRSSDLEADPSPVLRSVTDFLGVAPLAFSPQSVGGSNAWRVFVGNYTPPPSWSPGRLATQWLLRGEKRLLSRRHRINLP